MKLLKKLQENNTMPVKTDRVLQYVLIVYSVSWLLAAIFYLTGGNLRSFTGGVFSLTYMFIPMLTVIFLQKAIYHENIFKPMSVSFQLNRWLFVAWLTPPVLAFAALGLALLFPNVTFSPGMEGMYERFSDMLTREQIQQMRAQAEALPVHPIWIGLFEALLAGVTINAVAGFGEELGWRGFLHKHLASMGFWKSSYTIGILWGVWHWPIIAMGHNYPQHPFIGIFMMIALTVLLGPLFSYVRVKGGSVIHASIAHGTFNASYGLAIIVIMGGSDLLVGMTGLAGLLVLAVFNGALFMLDRAPQASGTLSSQTNEAG